MHGQAAPDPQAAPPVTITLDEAIARAQKSEANYAAAVAAGRSAAQDRNIAFSNLLPSVVYQNQGIYTQPQKPYSKAASTEPTQIYIANNGIREYLSQGVVSETIGLAGVAELRRTQAVAAQAAAQREIARRGLVAAVVSLFYGSLAADNKLTVAERAGYQTPTARILSKRLNGHAYRTGGIVWDTGMGKWRAATGGVE